MFTNKIKYLISQIRWVNVKRNIACSSFKSKIFLFCVPTHPNLGDQAQLMCWKNLFNEWYPDTRIICIPGWRINIKLLELIHRHLNSSDRIYIHSGYLMSDEHPDLRNIRTVVDFFRNYHITILPQTINIKNLDNLEATKKCFSKHSNLTIFSRDEVSYNNALTLFSKNRNILYPDVVTSMIGCKFYYSQKNCRNGILFCLRNDSEKYYSEKEIETLIKKFKDKFIFKCDTSINATAQVLDRQREKFIQNFLKMTSRFQVVVTDRYHGTLLSLVTNTPTVVLSSTDHKLISGVKWFPKNLFGDNIFFAESLEDAYIIIMKILSRNGKEIENPPYFKQNFFQRPI